MEKAKVVFSLKAKKFLEGLGYEGIGLAESWSPRNRDEVYKLPAAIHPQLYLKEAPFVVGSDTVCHIDVRELPIIDTPTNELKLKSFIVAVDKGEDGKETRKIFRNQHYPAAAV